MLTLLKKLVPKKKSKDTVLILSFDPGAHNSGWAISSVLLQEHSIYVHSYGGIHAVTDVKKSHKLDCEVYGTQIISQEYYYHTVRSLIQKYRPTHVATEDVFMHSKFPSAHTSLTLCVYNIALAAKHEGIVCTRIAPKLVKKIVSGDGTSMKVSIQDAIINHPKILLRYNSNQNSSQLFMNEHEADAIAVGYALAVQLFNSIY